MDEPASGLDPELPRSTGEIGTWGQGIRDRGSSLRTFSLYFRIKQQPHRHISHFGHVAFDLDIMVIERIVQCRLQCKIPEAELCPEVYQFDGDPGIKRVDLDFLHSRPDKGIVVV